MTFIDKLASRLGYTKIQSQGSVMRRSFKSAMVDRLTTDWSVTTLSADSEAYRYLRNLRARARSLCSDNDFAKKFLGMVQANIAGEKGVHLQMMVKDSDKIIGNKLIPGDLDAFANKTISDAWKQQCLPVNCTVAGNQSWVATQKLALRTAAVDGECLALIYPRFDNSMHWSMEIVETDILDHELNRALRNGRQIRMGVESNQYGKPINYWLLNQNPNDDLGVGSGGSPRYRVVPADYVLHLKLPRRAQETRGLTWFHTAMSRMNMLGGYEDAEVTAARVAAAKMGFLETSGDADYKGPKDVNGAKYMDAEPGSFEQLPEGLKLSSWDPQHPNSQYEAFMRQCLRGVAAGLDVAYHTLANDYSSVNFSSGRLGSNEEREFWKAMQCWFIESFVQPYFERWLKFQLGFGFIPLPATKFDKFNAPKWQARRWAYIEPQKEITANIMAIQAGLTSRTRVLAEQGLSFRDIFEELRDEEELAEELEINISGDAEDSGTEDEPPTQTGNAGSKPPPKAEPSEDV